MAYRFYSQMEGVWKAMRLLLDNNIGLNYTLSHLENDGDVSS